MDIVVATPQGGLLAIEVKDCSGWLFGNEKQQYWTQVLNYGKKSIASTIQSCRMPGI